MKLTAISKVFEEVIYGRWFQHLSLNDILLNEQRGIRSGPSTKLAGFVMLNATLLAMNNKLIFGDIVCDLEKAFNCVNRGILLSKLQIYGVVGKFEILFITYLKIRKW